jgi:hypothetical protein
MSHISCRFTVLFLAVFLLGCSRSNGSSPQNETGQTIETFEIKEGDLSVDENEYGKMAYVECEENEAETVLIVHISIPNKFNDYSYRIPLLRRKTLNNAGPMHASYGDGRTEDNKRTWFNRSINVSDSTDSTLTLAYSISWGGQEQSRGKFETSLSIKVGESAEKEFDGNIKMWWTFESPTMKNK